MLEVSELSVSYGNYEVVRRASLTVPSGTVTVLIGPNGSGKTTFLRALCGLLPISHGRIVVDGNNVTTLPTHKRGIGMLFQSTNLFPALDVHGNVGFGLRTQRPRLAQDEMARRIDDALRAVDMNAHVHDDVTTLSGGQCRRVDIARVLAPRPRCLLLDEPTSMLDAESVEHVTSALKVFVRQHEISVVCITHDADEAERIGDAVVAFADLAH